MTHSRNCLCSVCEMTKTWANHRNPLKARWDSHKNLCSARAAPMDKCTRLIEKSPVCIVCALSLTIVGCEKTFAPLAPCCCSMNACTTWSLYAMRCICTLSSSLAVKCRLCLLPKLKPLVRTSSSMLPRSLSTISVWTALHATDAPQPSSFCAAHARNRNEGPETHRPIMRSMHEDLQNRVRPLKKCCAALPA